MSREQQRLDRLMAMLAGEASQGRDMTAEVLRRLALRSRARRRRRALLALALVGGLGVASWVGVQSWQAHARATDLGELGRRGARWLLPAEEPARSVMPVRFVPKRRGETPMAVAPWGRT